VPYSYGSETRRYLPDFKAKIDRDFDAMLIRAGAVSTKVPT
jgi:hypothetical protein